MERQTSQAPRGGRRAWPTVLALSGILTLTGTWAGAQNQNPPPGSTPPASPAPPAANNTASENAPLPASVRPIMARARTLLQLAQNGMKSGPKEAQESYRTAQQALSDLVALDTSVPGSPAAPGATAPSPRRWPMPAPATTACE